MFITIKLFYFEEIVSIIINIYDQAADHYFNVFYLILQIPNYPSDFL